MRYIYLMEAQAETKGSPCPCLSMKPELPEFYAKNIPLLSNTPEIALTQLHRLAHFCKNFLVKLEDLFVQVLALAQAMKLVMLGQISLDGTNNEGLLILYRFDQGIKFSTYITCYPVRACTNYICHFFTI